jgi:hypothetical protein
MIAMLMRSLSVIGILLNLAGIGCAVAALRRTWRQGEQVGHLGRMFPRWYDQSQKLSLWVQRGLRRPRDATVHQVGLESPVAGSGNATISVTGAPINKGDPLDVQIKALYHRIDLVERTMIEDRAERDRQVKLLRQDTQLHFERLQSRDAEVKALALGLTLDTLRLQMRGVVLVASGAIVGSIPVLFA